MLDDDIKEARARITALGEAMVVAAGGIAYGGFAK
jgi:hypothetical protein